jgi:hypothetical protein
MKFVMEIEPKHLHVTCATVEFNCYKHGTLRLYLTFTFTLIYCHSIDPKTG